MSDAMRTETVMITGAGGDEIEGYLARPLDHSGLGGVLVMPSGRSARDRHVSVVSPIRTAGTDRSGHQWLTFLQK